MGVDIIILGIDILGVDILRLTPLKQYIPFQAYRVMLRLLEPGPPRGGRVGGWGGYFTRGPQTFKGPHEAFILLLWLHLQALSLSSLSIALSGLSESTLE